ncbi:MAG: type II toxin-antitoxin system VapC family toxin [Gemmatimonadota bacterium]
MVVDASLVVAALVDAGDVGRWAEDILLSDHLCAPHLMPVEVANILRRTAAAGDVSPGVASLAHADLLALRADLYPYAPIATRAWALRDNLTLYDAWYVALAELLDAPLATLDARLARAAGPLCEIRLP